MFLLEHGIHVSPTANDEPWNIIHVSCGTILFVDHQTRVLVVVGQHVFLLLAL